MMQYTSWQCVHIDELAEVNYLNKFFIVRITFVFELNENKFIQTTLKVGKKHPEARVVKDQIVTPTYTFNLVRLLVDIAENDKYDHYHATNEGGYIQWYDFNPLPI